MSPIFCPLGGIEFLSQRGQFVELFCHVIIENVGGVPPELRRQPQHFQVLRRFQFVEHRVLHLLCYCSIFTYKHHFGHVTGVSIRLTQKQMAPQLWHIGRNKAEYHEKPMWIVGLAIGNEQILRIAFLASSQIQKAHDILLVEVDGLDIGRISVIEHVPNRYQF